ncbi:hypothetical protein BC826DRAFT_201406 [Russula brevipes]|nr:hypothetical protein BC826DRAFT_201406 [Russula brevipes]
MGTTSSTQRGGNVTQPQTVLRKSTNANTPNDVAQQAANITKDNDNLIFPNIKQDTKKDYATPTEGPISAAVATMPSETYSNTTSPATKFPDQAAKGPSPPVSRVANIEPSKLTNAISSSETPQVLEVVASEDTKGAPNRALAPKQVDQRIDAQPGKRPRKVRGKGKSKTGANAGRHDTENIPPPAARQIAPYRRRRAPGSGLNEIGARPARRGKATHGVGGAGALEAAEVVNGANSRSAEADVKKAMGRHPHIGGPRDHGLASARPMGRTTRRLPSKGDIRKKSDSGLEIIAVENAEMPKVDNDAKTAADGHSDHRSIPAPLGPPIGEDAAASSPCETGFPEPSAEGDASIVQPLPSSTRRRAKEYFQRRTRERSVDAAGRHIRRPRRSATVTEQGILSNVQVPRSQQDIKEGAVGKASEKLAGRGADAKPDHFEFDPEASPFTPSATSSPRQASFSSIGVQSLSSPTPLPSHGNRKVAPLILPKTSNRSTQLETRGDSLAQLIPITSHGIPGPPASAANRTYATTSVLQLVGWKHPDDRRWYWRQRIRAYGHVRRGRRAQRWRCPRSAQPEPCSWKGPMP